MKIRGRGFRRVARVYHSTPRDGQWRVRSSCGPPGHSKGEGGRPGAKEKPVGTWDAVVLMRIRRYGPAPRRLVSWAEKGSVTGWGRKTEGALTLPTFPLTTAQWRPSSSCHPETEDAESEPRVVLITAFAALLSPCLGDSPPVLAHDMVWAGVGVCRRAKASPDSRPVNLRHWWLFRLSPRANGTPSQPPIELSRGQNREYPHQRLWWQPSP